MSSTPDAPVARCLFLELPLELRWRIYEALNPPEWIDAWYDDPCLEYKPATGRGREMGLLARTSTQLEREILHWFPKHCGLRFLDLASFAMFINAKGPGALSHARKVSLLINHRAEGMIFHSYYTPKDLDALALPDARITSELGPRDEVNESYAEFRDNISLLNVPQFFVTVRVLDLDNDRWDHDMPQWDGEESSILERFPVGIASGGKYVVSVQGSTKVSRVEYTKTTQGLGQASRENLTWGDEAMIRYGDESGSRIDERFFWRFRHGLSCLEDEYGEENEEPIENYEPYSWHGDDWPGHIFGLNASH